MSTSMPMGWFRVCSHELGVGDAIPVEYFGQSWWYSEQRVGTKVVDAFCPHMGAHLWWHPGTNRKGPRIVGDSIDALSTAGAGMATANAPIFSMPTSYLRVLLKASQSGCLASKEVNQQILVWYHPKKEAPTWEPEVIPEARTP